MKVEYTIENNSPFTVAEMTGLFRNHEIVTFTIPGVGETCAETALFRDALEELQRLAAKGLRAEQAISEIEAEIKSHTERGDYADRKGDKEESQRLWDMVAGLYIALDKLTGEGADRLKGAE